MNIMESLPENKFNKSYGILIGGFKAIGKSTLATKYDDVIDLESSNFEYIIDEKIKNISVERRKGLKVELRILNIL